MSDNKKKNKQPSDEVNTQPVVKPKKDLNSGEDVLDLLTLRDSDTSKLKKIKPKSSTQTIDLDSKNISDTAHLRVIKEKKKQLAGILTASQTIRLRPPSKPGGPPSTPAQAQLSQTADQSAGSINIPSRSSASSGTLKVNMPPSSSDSGTIKVSKPNFIESASTATLKIKKPVSADSGVSGGGTLKIKSAAPGSGTLKLKPDLPSNRSTRPSVEESNKKGGTLRLKAKSNVARTNQRSGVKRHSAREEENVEEIQPTEAENAQAKPGVFMALSSLVALVALGITTFKLIDSYMTLFS